MCSTASCVFLLSIFLIYRCNTIPPSFHTLSCMNAVLSLSCLLVHLTAQQTDQKYFAENHKTYSNFFKIPYQIIPCYTYQGIIVIIIIKVTIKASICFSSSNDKCNILGLQKTNINSYLFLK